MKRIGKKILVVDDQSYMCTFLSDVLGDFGDVVTSQRLEDARNLLSKDEFDLAIFDLSLTGKHGNEGFELLKRARATSL